jgi:SAM-dependent methyltransferase
VTLVATRCPLCGADAPLLWDEPRDLEYFMEASYDFLRCSGCGLVFMDPMPTREELPGLYPSNYHNFDAPSGRIPALLLDRYYAHQVRTCRKHLPPGGSVLEVGCAAGDVLERLQGAGHRVTGIELSKEACDLAAQKGLDVFQGTLDEFETDQRFDLVFMSHVIEHVIDPVATVAKIARLLQPGGVLYIETPNVRSLDARLWRQGWGLIHYPRHLYLFDRTTIRRLLERGGLSVESVKPELNSCGWALSVQSSLRRRGIDRVREPRSPYYPLLLLLFLPANLVDLCFGGTAFMSAIARKGGTRT